MNPKVFEINPLDMGIAGVQWKLTKRIKNIESDAFDRITEMYESRSPTMPPFSVEVNCFPDTEKGGIVLQFIFKAVNGDTMEKSTTLKTKEELLEVVENQDFLFFCKRMLVKLLGEEVLDEDIRKERLNGSMGTEASTKCGMLPFRRIGKWWKKLGSKVYVGLQGFKNKLSKSLVTVRNVGRKCFRLVKFKIDRLRDFFHKDTYSEKLYKHLMEVPLPEKKYRVEYHKEKMAIINQLIGQYWKPRCLMNHQTKCAYSIMDASEYITLFTTADIAWETLIGIPGQARERAEMLDAHFPTFIHRFVNGVAQMSWEINPDGRYYRDEDGLGMSDDEAIKLYGFIDRNGKVVVKFRKIKDYDELAELRAYAEKIVANK